MMFLIGLFAGGGVAFVGMALLSAGNYDRGYHDGYKDASFGKTPQRSGPNPR